MTDDWSDAAFAAQWDRTGAQRNNAVRAEQLDLVTEVIAEAYRPGTSILDLGCGSGQVEELIFRKRPDARVVGVDSSEAMLAIARRRHAGDPGRFQIIAAPLETLDPQHLPPGPYSAVFSAQVLHELDAERRRALFRTVAALLPAGGIFVIMDRVRTDLEAFDLPYRAAWRRLERRMAETPAGGFEAYKRRIHAKQDDPASLDEFRELLAEAGFHFVLLHFDFDRAVMVGLRR